jgi:hypothetical protein
VVLQKSADKRENFVKLSISKPLSEKRYQLIVRKFLQIAYDRVFVSFPFKAKADKAFIFFHKFMRMFGHNFTRRKKTQTQLYNSKLLQHCLEFLLPAFPYGSSMAWQDCGKIMLQQL